MAKPFRDLRAKLKYEDLSQIDLARQINISAPTMTLKLNGERPFTMPEVFRICDVLNIPEKDILVYFRREDMSKLLVKE
jgi:transcriptional regulator with XRE-family HTH domain